MKRVSAILLVVVSMIVTTFTGAIAQESNLVPAATFPYEIIAENYVPSLYFSVAQSRDEQLVAVPDFPSVTWGLCYCPSLYYEAWKVKAVQAMR